MVVNQVNGNIIDTRPLDGGLHQLNAYFMKPITLEDPAQAYNNRIVEAQLKLKADDLMRFEASAYNKNYFEGSRTSTQYASDRKSEHPVSEAQSRTDANAAPDAVFVPDTISISHYSSIGKNGGEENARLSPQELVEYGDSLSLLNAMDNAALAKWRQNAADYDARHGLRAANATAINNGNILPGVIVAQLASNIITHDGGSVISPNGSNIIAAGGGNLIGDGASTIIAAGGGNVISPNGSNIIAAGGGNLIGDNGSTIIAAGGGNLVGNSGGTLVSNASGTLVSNASGTLVSNASGTFGFSGGNAIAFGGRN